jgi:steroid delta-isomerase-like uncharacterized protein
MATAQTQTTPAVDPSWLEDFVQRWTDAWNGHRAEPLLDLMTPDIVYDDSAWPRTMRGHSDVREFAEHTWTAFPDLRFEVLDGPFLHQSEPQATAYWRGFATHTGPIDPPGIPATGRRIEFTGFDFHEYRDGKVARLVITFDMADVARQLGLLPAPGSAGEKAMAAFARARAKVQDLLVARGGVTG